MILRDRLRIPPGWNLHCLGRVTRRVQVSGCTDLPPLSVFLEDGVVPRSFRDDNHNRLGEDLSKYLVVKPGDIVFNKLRTWQGGLGVSKYEGIVSPAYFVCTPGPTLEPRYVHYLLRSHTYLEELTRTSKWMPPSQFDIGWDQLRLLPLLVPPLEAQRAIAEYLDVETARIDALIAKKRQLANLIDERFRSLVDTVVSSGPERESRRVTSLITSGPRGWSDLAGDSGRPFIRSANLQRASLALRTTDLARVDIAPSAEASRSQVQVGDVLIGITGANTAWVGIVTDEVAGGYISQHVAVMRPSSILPEWLAFSLFGRRVQEQLLAGQYGGTKLQLGLDELAGTRICVPSPAEQRNLVDRLCGADEHRRAVIEGLTAQIGLLQERRQTLITAAVTGQFGVPEGSAA